jgi:NAD(P)-dependent dehydrogenase (short-subunit alcohol dehydrogenase family)
MTGLLEGKLALITGAGSGIGAGIAHGMADAGARVIAVDINADAARATAAAIGAGASSYATDVSDRAACDALASAVKREQGAIAVLVNNAGVVRRGPITDAGARRDWDATLGVNLDGPYFMTTAFLEQLRETRGAVINLGSIQSFVGRRNSAAYTVSKGGVLALTKALAIELSPMGVRVNALAPGLIATPINEKARQEQNPSFVAPFEDRIPLGRLGAPEDIAGPAVFLASDMARYITGVTLPVDGGYLCL